MGETATLWVDRQRGDKGLIQFLRSQQVSFGVMYVEETSASRPLPVLFTAIGSFEGDASIRRVASLLR